MAAKSLGRHITADPEICHGQPTFRGTRILVADVLDQVAEGMEWGTIVQEWHGSLSRVAIAEAVAVASRPLLDHVHDYVVEPASA